MTEGCDLSLASGTPAAQAVAGATADIPVIGTAITDFAASGLVRDTDSPGGYVSGTSDMNPVADQIALLDRLAPDAKKVGLLYCTAESNSKLQIDLAAAELDELKKLGMEGVEFTVSSSNEVQQVAESMVGAVDAIYTPTDNTIASAMATIATIANEAGVPTVCGEVAHVEAGGLASLSINYEELGRRAGEMAVRILAEGAEPAGMPIESMGAAECESINYEELGRRAGEMAVRILAEGAEPAGMPIESMGAAECDLHQLRGARPSCRRDGRAHPRRGGRACRNAHRVHGRGRVRSGLQRQDRRGARHRHGPA